MSFAPRADSSVFTSLVAESSDQSNEARWLLPALKSTSHFLPQSVISIRPDSSLEAKSVCCHKSETWSLLTVVSTV